MRAGKCKKIECLVTKPSQGICGTVDVPADKSISHRALMLGAIADGITTVSNLLCGEDVLATLVALQQLGVEFDGPCDKGSVSIQGVGLYGLHAPAWPLNLGNSGTAMRLLTGFLAGQKFSSQLIGDQSLMQRPMQRISQPLSQMSAHIDTQEGYPPLKIIGKPLQAITYELPIASAQIKSCLLLAGLYAKGQTQIIEPTVTRDHTELMLQAFSYPIERKASIISLQGGGKLLATNLSIPADLSSAAFFLVASSIIPGSKLMLPNILINPTRNGIIKLLQLMGADLKLINQRYLGAELVADIEVRYSDKLTGIVVPPSLISLAIDEFPIFFIAASCAKGTTTLRGAKELRVKESDRIHAMATGLQQLGISVIEYPDGLSIKGGDLQGGIVDSFDDHRVAMAFIIAGQIAKEPVVVNRCNNIITSFPNFVVAATSVGMNVCATKSEIA